MCVLNTVDKFIVNLVFIMVNYKVYIKHKNT